MPNSVRLDKWLWAARFYKTRQLAVKAVKNSQVKTGNQSLKPASSVNLEDVITIQRGLFEVEIEVTGLSDKRGSAKIAQALYQETQASIDKRESLKVQLDAQPKIDTDKRRPEKRQRRNSRDFKRDGSNSF